MCWYTMWYTLELLSLIKFSTPPNLRLMTILDLLRLLPALNVLLLSVHETGMIDCFRLHLSLGQKRVQKLRVFALLQVLHVRFTILGKDIWMVIIHELRRTHTTLGAKRPSLRVLKGV